MPSSISNSDVGGVGPSPFGNKGYLVLLAVVALILAGVELVTRYIVPRFDGGMRFHATEVHAAIELRPTVSPRQVLVCGNSLLDNGVLFDEAARSLRPQIDAERLMVPDTNYYDWYFGLRRLFAEGSQPDVIVLMLSPRQLVASRIRESYSPYHMFLAGDLFRVARELNFSNTATSNLYFAHYSAYFGYGDEVRKGILRRILPGLPLLMANMTHVEPPPLVPANVLATATERLLALRDLAAAWNVRLVLVVPPSGEAKGDEAYLAVQRAGKASGVPVLMPAGIGSIEPGLYADKFHLNSRGAKLFTPLFADTLRRKLIGR